MVLYVYFVIIIYFASVTVSNGSKYAKIDMVAAIGNSIKPALFTHGESPVWDQESNSLYFVDVHRHNVHRLDYYTGKIYSKHIGYGEVNVVTPICKSSRLLVAVRSALYLLDWEVPGDAALRLLTTVDQGLPDNVINEGKADAIGRYWAGTKGRHIGINVLPDKASLYSISHKSLTPVVHLRPVSISNGLTWSLNNSVFYYIDSPTQKVEAFDFDLLTGEISGRRTIIDIAVHGYQKAIPDGMTIDRDGNLWVAVMFGATVLHIDPASRRIIFRYRLPASRVTSVAWGGPNLDELFVTTSQIHNDNKTSGSSNGAIFTITNTGSMGVTSHCFRFDNADEY